MILKLVPAIDIEDEKLRDTIKGINIDILKKNKEELMKLEIVLNEMIKFAIKEKGFGLSAIQVGIYKKIFVFRDRKGEWEKVINPQVFKIGSPKLILNEKCLSYPNQIYEVKRNKRISVSYYTLIDHKIVRKHKELNGMNSIIFQHEYDHQIGQTIAIKGKLIKMKMKK